MLAVDNCYKRGCIFYLGVSQPDGTEETEVNSCYAYPLGIPDRIAYGDDPHEEVQDDQQGVFVFEEGLTP